MITSTIKTFSYNGYTLDLFTDNSNIFYNYAITIFSMEKGTMYIHSAIDDIYEAFTIFDGYKMDLLKEGRPGLKETV